MKTTTIAAMIIGTLGFIFFLGVFLGIHMEREAHRQAFHVEQSR